MAKIILFPQTRRVALIARAAKRIKSLHNPKHAEEYLIALLEKLQVELHTARISQEKIDDELIALAVTIKATAFRGARRFSPGGLG